MENDNDQKESKKQIIISNRTLEGEDFVRLVAAYETLNNADIHSPFSSRERHIIRVLTLEFVPKIKNPRGRPKNTNHLDIAMESFGVANWFFATNGQKRTKSFEQTSYFLNRTYDAVKKHHTHCVSYFNSIELVYQDNRLLGEGFDPTLSEKEYWKEFLRIHGYRTPT
ncbi:MAG: hypothetical protein EB015_05775 [Methylocystaceae bacterium]|nr:hypothetical protein [Methylocystaceae bacterium]